MSEVQTKFEQTDWTEVSQSFDVFVKWRLCEIVCNKSNFWSIFVFLEFTMSDEIAENGTANGDVPEIELIIKV